MIQRDTILKNIREIIDSTVSSYHFRVHNAFNLHGFRNWEIPDRKIDDWMLVYTRSGKGHYRLEGFPDPLENGKIYFISHNLLHSAKQEEICPASVIAIRFGIYDSQTTEPSSATFSPMGFSINANRSYYIQQLFEQICAYFKLYPDFIGANLCNALLCEIFCLIYLKLSETNDNSFPDKKMQYAKLYIENHLLEDLTLQKVSDYVELSPKYFSKKFKHQFNMTFKEYIFRSKMSYAKMLLQETGYSIKKIALILGYSDQYIFSKQFKKALGITPSKIKHKRV